MNHLRIIFYFILFITFKTTYAQVTEIKRISGLPTREVYDLMVDSKGFLWIAHDLGISRYDGINFTSYTYAGQTSISATDLLEDEYGRIWFHNFTGQILYIENGKMHLLDAYEYKKETAFPRIVIYQHQLFASTNRGLFACDLNTLKCKYILSADCPQGTASLTVIKNTLIAYGNGGNWFKYQGGGALSPILLRGDSTAFIKTNASTLTATTFRDTAYLLSNPAAVVSHITLEGDHLQLHQKTHAANFINTVTVADKNVWINSTQTSFLPGNPNSQIEGHNLTDMVTDHEGNTWYSSLNHGLLVKYKLLTGEPVPIPFPGDERVKCIEKLGPLLLFGTHASKIIVYDSERSKAIKQITLPGTPGVISAIYRLEGNKFLVGTNVSTYVVDIETGSTTLFSSIRTLKQVIRTARFTIMASAGGLFVRPVKDSDLSAIGKMFKGLTLRHDDGDYYTLPIRCRAVCYDIANQQIFVAFKDGLYTVNKSGMQPYNYNNAIVHPASLQYIDGKVITGTINDGLLIIDGSKTLHLTTDNGLSSNTIYKIKHIGNKIWLLGGGPPKLVDMTTLKIVTDMNMSALREVQVLDVADEGNKTFITTPDGLFWVRLSKSTEKFTIKNYLQAVLVNNKPLAFNAPHDFAYNENNIQFTLDVPFYYNAHDIYLKYLLKGANNKIWQTTKPGERNIAFSELSPGSYTLKVYAIHPELGSAKEPFIYSFVVNERWWEVWWFKALLILGVAGVVAYTAATYFLNRLSLQKAAYEQQLSIQHERQRISSEMHDDVGAGLSAMKLYFNMAKNESLEELDYTQMSNMLNDMTEKINEIIWSNSVKNDTLENLLYYIQYQSSKLFKHASLTFEVRVPAEIPYFEINGEKRRNIDLITREFLHNALKHSSASAISLDISVDDTLLKLIIKDNGKGFNPLNTIGRGMGMKNTRTRIHQLKGQMDLKSDQQGTMVTLAIPMV